MGSTMRKGLAGIILSGMLAGCGGRAISSSGPSSGDGILSLGFKLLGGLQTDPRRALLGDTLAHTIERESDRRTHERLQGNNPDYTVQNNNQFVEQPYVQPYVENPLATIVECEGIFSRRDPVYGEISISSSVESIEDRNGDGICRFPEDYIGLAEKFPVGTPINLHLGTARIIEYPSQIRMVLGQMRLGKSEVIGRVNGLAEWGRNYGMAVHYNSPNHPQLSSGKYHAHWFINEKFVGQIPFEVTDKK